MVQRITTFMKLLKLMILSHAQSPGEVEALQRGRDCRDEDEAYEGSSENDMNRKASLSEANTLISRMFWY